MSTKPHLSQRAIVAYNRLCREMAALNYLVRVAKPSGTLGQIGRECLDRALRIANRLYRREGGLPFFARIDAMQPLTNADVVLLVSRLTIAAVAFEERYAHLTGQGQSTTPAPQATLASWRDPAGLPSPHA